MKSVKKLLAIVLTLALVLPFISDAVVLRGHAEDLATLGSSFVKCDLVSQGGPSCYNATYTVTNSTNAAISKVIYKLDGAAKDSAGVVSVSIAANGSAQVTVPYYTWWYGGGNVNCTFYPQTIDSRFSNFSFSGGQYEQSGSVSFQNSAENPFQYAITILRSSGEIVTMSGLAQPGQATTYNTGFGMQGATVVNASITKEYTVGAENSDNPGIAAKMVCDTALDNTMIRFKNVGKAGVSPFSGRQFRTDLELSQEDLNAQAWLTAGNQFTYSFTLTFTPQAGTSGKEFTYKGVTNSSVSSVLIPETVSMVGYDLKSATIDKIEAPTIIGLSDVTDIDYSNLAIKRTASGPVFNSKLTAGNSEFQYVYEIGYEDGAGNVDFARGVAKSTDETTKLDPAVVEKLQTHLVSYIKVVAISKVDYSSEVDGLSYIPDQTTYDQPSGVFHYGMTNTTGQDNFMFEYEINYTTKYGTIGTPVTGWANNASGTITLSVEDKAQLDSQYAVLQGISIKRMLVLKNSCPATWLNVVLADTKTNFTITNTCDSSNLNYVAEEVAVTVNGQAANTTSAIEPQGVVTYPINWTGTTKMIIEVAGVSYYSPTKNTSLHVGNFNNQQYNDTWLAPVNCRMRRTETGEFQFDITLRNSSEDTVVSGISYNIRYKAAGQEKNISDSVSVSANPGTNGSFSVNVAGADGDFSFEHFSITDIASQVDVAPDLTRTTIANPSIETSSLKIRQYVVWSKVKFGSYQQSASSATSKQDLEWRVLEVKDNVATLISEKALFSRAYDSSMLGTSWDVSNLRKYLNDDFKNEAFSAEEQKSIVTSALTTADSTSGAKGGAATSDQVYIPSIADMNNDTYMLFGAAKTETTVPTRQFTASKKLLNDTPGLTVYVDGKGQEYCNYLLRSPGYYSYDVAGVNYNGILKADGWRTYTKTAGVIPMVKVNVDALTLVGSTAKQLPKGYNTGEAKASKATKTKKLKTLTVGDKKTINKATYKITASTKATRTVAVTSVAKQTKKVTIPSTVKINGTKYKVTAIKAGAFKNAKKSLRTINITSKNIKTVSKKAFSGLTSKTTVKIKKTQYKKLKKMIKNKKIKVQKIK